MFLDGRTEPLPRITDVHMDPRGQGGQSPRAIVWALSFVVLSFGIMQTMLVPSVGVLQREFDTTPAGASWAVVSATLLVSAVVTPLIGRLGDRYGKRRTLLWSLAIYFVGTASAIVAPNLGVLIVLRGVQGIGLSLLPLTFAIVREALPRSAVPFGLALTSGLVGGTAGVGLLVGGVLVDYASWNWLFVVGSVVILIALVLTALHVPESPTRASGGIDVWGTVTLACGMVALLLGITQGPVWGWFSPPVLGLFAGAVVILAVFGALERRIAHPVIDIRLLTQRSLLLTHLGALALGVNQFLFYILLPKLAQLPNDLPAAAEAVVDYGFGASVTGAALIVLPGTLLVLPASWSANRVERGFGKRAPLVLGLVLAGAAGILLAFGHAQVWQVVVFNLVCSAGHGFAMAALPSLVNEASEPTQSASANGINTVARVFGGAVGSQIASAILGGVVIAGTGYPAESGFVIAFVVAAGVGLLGALLVPLGRVRRHSPILEEAPEPPVDGPATENPVGAGASSEARPR